VAVRDIHRKIV